MTGNKTIYAAIKNCGKFARLLQKQGWDGKLKDRKILAISPGIMVVLVIFISTSQVDP